VSPQPADGLASVVIPFEHGNVEPKILISLASFLENFGNNTIRFSMRQNIHLRNIPNEYLGNIYNLLHEFDVETEVPLLINNLVACTGADTCRLGICLAKGASSQLRHSLRKSEIDLDKLSDFRINISGCPNSCGQQSAADLGFYGKVGRTDRMYPAYNVVAGGTSGEENTALAEKICEISARDLPELTSQILEDYSAKTDQYKSFKSYLESEGRELLISLSNKYKNIPNWRDDKNYYYDWGSDNVFSLVGKGLGECSAGLFDMIDVDLNSIKSHQSEIKATKDAEKINISLHGIVFSAARMLLVTKGVEPKSIKDVYELFIKNFIEDGLVSDKYRFIIENVIKDDYSDLTPLKDDIYDLARIVIDLYDSLDDSLQFKIEKVGPKEKQIEESSTILKKDFRGVACPMNFVKTKLALATIKTGEVLEIYLDDGEPIENVPGSVKGEGHKIISQTRIGDYWSVVIKKS
jgi:sulfite reductase (ferredoxin)